MRNAAIVLTLLAALATSAAASNQEVMTAGDLQQLCAGSDHVSKNVCRVYILGVAQGITLGMNIADGKSHGGRPCVPADTSGESLEQSLKAKLDQHLAATPADQQREAAEVIGTVLASTYPCSPPAH
jgi:Rap1a immunity proteins